MKKSVVVLFLSLISYLFAADMLRVSGWVTLEDCGLANVMVAGTQTDSTGYFHFEIPAGSDTSFAPHLNHYLFEPEQLIIQAQDSILDSVHFAASRQKKRTIIVSGQSNATQVGQYPFFKQDTVDRHIPYFCATTGKEYGLSTLGPLSNFNALYPKNFGFENLLGRTIYKQYCDSLAVIKIAWGGTSLIENWGERGVTWTWFKEMHEHAVDSLHAEGYEPEYIGFFWYQGESDRTLDRYSVYGDSLYRFVDRIREYFPNASEVDSLPFVCVRILWNPQCIYEEPVRQAQMDIVNRRSFTAWVDIDDCDPCRLSSTNPHYNGIALNRIGYKLASAYLDIVEHPVDSSATVTVDLEGDIDSTMMLYVEGDTAFYDYITGSSYQFPAKMGDSLSLKLLMPTQDYVSDPGIMTIPFVYDPSAILDGAYTFHIDIKTELISYKDDMDAMACKVYPNPFNPNTQISIDLPTSGHAELAVFNLLGQKVVSLINGSMQKGHYDIDWHAGALPGGMYIARLTAGNRARQTKLLLLK